ncbi:MAG: hypothetical protein L3J93_06320, partial [Thermoplasmata archaeon]|nr:hypothetical protein [Thermoplasmata archaeon]
MNRSRSASAWTRRSRRFRSGRRGLVSVVATLFALLLLVLLISIFMLGPLGSQEQSLETQHTLQVENQVAELQQALAFEGAHASFPTTFTSPVTLGTTGVPPFGASTYGTLQVQGASAATADGITITQVVPLNISWTPSLPSCNNCKLDYYNVSVNHTTNGVVSARGNAGYEIILNLLGENNTNLDIDLRGKATTVYVVVGGSNNSVTFTNSGSPSTTNATFLFFGQHNTFDLSTYGRMGIVDAVFISKVGHTCPYANQSVTDHFFLPTANVSGLNVTATWWNFVGYSNPIHQVKDPATNFIYWNESLSGPTGCAFTKATSVNYPLASSGSVLVHLSNNYAPPADIAFEQGAVIGAEGGGIPVMVEPPLISVSPFTPGGLSGKVTLFTFV